MSKSISQIRQEFDGADEKSGEELCRLYAGDARAGVQNLIARYRRRQAALKKERARLDEMMFYEKKYSGYERICGIDEAGRGPLQVRWLPVRLFFRKTVRSWA